MCFDNEAVLLSVAEPESAERNVPTGSDLMRFGSSAGENLLFPSVCRAGVASASVRVVFGCDGMGGEGVGVERYGNKQVGTFGPQVAESAA